jgi:hypothetical protein
VTQTSCDDELVLSEAEYVSEGEELNGLKLNQCNQNFNFKEESQASTGASIIKNGGQGF